MATPSYRYFGLTGDSIIDGTTHGYYWGLNADRTVDWSISSGLAGEIWTNPNVSVNTFAAILATYSYYANIKFNYVGDFTAPTVASQNGSEINFSLSGSTSFFSSSNIWARGYFPYVSFDSSYQGQAGDIYLNMNSDANYLPSYSPGSAGWFVFMHEIGHVLGLKHPHDSGGTGRPTLTQLGLDYLDIDWGTIMSYADDFDWNLQQWDPASPMILDVLALQYIYGKNLSTNAGDTVITLTQTNYYQTFWDASGNDTASAEGSSVGWTIYLPDLPMSQLVDTKVGSAMITSELNLAAPQTLSWLTGDIENAIGGSGNDTIYGNAFDNSLQGGYGDDVIFGEAGDDTFDWLPVSRGGADIFYGGTGDDIFVLDSVDDQVAEYTNEGSDTIFVTFDFSLSNYRYLENLLGIGSTGVTLVGNENVNVMGGTLGNDRIDGVGGDDCILADAGNDVLDGGAGIDEVIFNGNRSSYTVTKIFGEWGVDSTTGGLDTLISIERLKFSDLTIALDIDGNAGQSYRLYQAAFNRAPDNDGLKYWIGILDSGFNLQDVSSAFLLSDEFKTMYGSNPTNSEFVTKLYSHVLHRTPDQGGYDYWVDLLDKYQINARDTLINFSESDENQLALMGTIQNGIELYF